uniref:copper amine oxidase n=1 Tax=Pedobacter schmidteae TaxID=2201271 RepID=UPI000EB3703B|nr:copper amine oxidase [Pedobacter schmidteae]
MKHKNLKMMLSLALICGATQLNAQTVDKNDAVSLLKAKQGNVVLLKDFFTIKPADIKYKKVVLPGPQFIISDDPEYIRIPEGIALKEAVQPGSVRLYVYNVNGVKEPVKIDRKITAVIKNTGKQKMHIRMLKYSSQKPSGNYFQIGKQGLADYFASNGDQKIRTVEPGEAIAIDEQLERNVVKYDELTHGFYDFVIDQPGEISVIQTDMNTPGPVALKRIKSVIPTGHKNAGRGLFGVSNYKITATDVLDTKNGAAEIVVADGEKDPWVLGVEGVSGKESTLAGNYGVMYDMELKWKSTDGKGLALVTWNSRSGDNQWCNGMAATMVVSKGKFNEGIIQLPNDRLATKGAPEAILIQVFPPAKNGEEQVIKFTYSPPGASCLPTPLVFIPVDMNLVK